MELKGDGRGRTAKAPPPDEFQFTLIYCWHYRQQRLEWVDRTRTPDAETMLVSQALFVTLTFSKPYSFFALWPKTWLRIRWRPSVAESAREGNRTGDRTGTWRL